MDGFYKKTRRGIYFMFRCDPCGKDFDNQHNYQRHLSSHGHYLKTLVYQPNSGKPLSFITDQWGEQRPVIRARKCRHGGLDSLEVLCPFCGQLHFHTPQPIPSYRDSHCHFPWLMDPDTYYISEIYTDPNPQICKPEGWINYREEKVKRIH